MIRITPDVAGPCSGARFYRPLASGPSFRRMRGAGGEGPNPDEPVCTRRFPGQAALCDMWRTPSIAKPPEVVAKRSCHPRHIAAMVSARGSRPANGGRYVGPWRKPQATVIGTSHPTSSVNAALANGRRPMATRRRFPSARAVPSGSGIVPAALATAELGGDQGNDCCARSRSVTTSEHGSSSRSASANSVRSPQYPLRGDNFGATAAAAAIWAHPSGVRHAFLLRPSSLGRAVLVSTRTCGEGFDFGHGAPQWRHGATMIGRLHRRRRLPERSQELSPRSAVRSRSGRELRGARHALRNHEHGRSRNGPLAHR